MSIASFAGRKLDMAVVSMASKVSKTNGFANSVMRNMLSIDPLGLFTSAAELITNC
jgi:hypothetical protein